MASPHDLIRQILNQSELLIREAQRSEHFRQALNHLAAWLHEVSDRHPTPHLGEPKILPRHLGHDFHADTPADLRLIQTRAQLKIEACQFAVERNAFYREHNRIDEYKPRYDHLIARAKDLPRCILWMVRLDMINLPEAALRDAQICYQNLADAAALMLAIDSASPSPEERRAAMDLLAEAQSALMVCFSRNTKTGMDQDQFDTWTWLKEQASASGVFLERFMSRENTADPANARDLAGRIAAARQALDQRAVKPA